MKLGCIGYGNMATAIFGGVAAAKLVPPSDILVCEPSADKQAQVQAKGFHLVDEIPALVDRADVIFICVKPKDFPVVLKAAAPAYTLEKTIVSIAAGLSTGAISSHLGREAAIVRTMPNTPLLLGKGTTAICQNARVAPAPYAFVKRIFESTGTVYELPEAQFDHVINLNGSSPAYIYLFAETVANFAHEQGGIDYATALSMFSDTLKGAAEMLQHSHQTPEALIKAVSSPGGTTVAALNAFEATGLTKSLRAGFSACVERAVEMGKENV